MNDHSAEIDALVREAYRLGYEDRSKERDYDPGHALDLLTSGIPPEPTPRTWDSDRWPTPEEWTEWFFRATHVERLAAAERVIVVSQEALECFTGNHKARLERHHETIGRLREVAAAAHSMLEAYPRSEWRGPGCDGLGCSGWDDLALPLEAALAALPKEPA